jgi:hypothetical protein
MTPWQIETMKKERLFDFEAPVLYRLYPASGATRKGCGNWAGDATVP